MKKHTLIKHIVDNNRNINIKIYGYTNVLNETKLHQFRSTNNIDSVSDAILIKYCEYQNVLIENMDKIDFIISEGGIENFIGTGWDQFVRSVNAMRKIYNNAKKNGSTDNWRGWKDIAIQAAKATGNSVEQFVKTLEDSGIEPKDIINAEDLKVDDIQDTDSNSQDVQNLSNALKKAYSQLSNGCVPNVIKLGVNTYNMDEKTAAGYVFAMAIGMYTTEVLSVFRAFINGDKTCDYFKTQTVDFDQICLDLDSIFVKIDKMTAYNQIEEWVHANIQDIKTIDTILSYFNENHMLKMPNKRNTMSLYRQKFVKISVKVMQILSDIKDDIDIIPGIQSKSDIFSVNLQSYNDAYQDAMQLLDDEDLNQIPPDEIVQSVNVVLDRFNVLFSADSLLPISDDVKKLVIKYLEKITLS